MTSASYRVFPSRHFGIHTLPLDSGAIYHIFGIHQGTETGLLLEINDSRGCHNTAYDDALCYERAVFRFLSDQETIDCICELQGLQLRERIIIMPFNIANCRRDNFRHKVHL